MGPTAQSGTFPCSGSTVRLISGVDKYGQTRSLRFGKRLGEVCHQAKPASYGAIGDDYWIVEVQSEGLVGLRAASDPSKCLGATTITFLAAVPGNRKVALQNLKQGHGGIDTKLQHPPAMGPLAGCVTHSSSNLQRFNADNDKWVLEVVNPVENGAPLWGKAAANALENPLKPSLPPCVPAQQPQQRQPVYGHLQQAEQQQDPRYGQPQQQQVPPYGQQQQQQAPYGRLGHRESPAAQPEPIKQASGESPTTQSGPVKQTSGESRIAQSGPVEKASAAMASMHVGDAHGQAESNRPGHEQPRSKLVPSQPPAERQSLAEPPADKLADSSKQPAVKVAAFDERPPDKSTAFNEPPADKPIAFTEKPAGDGQASYAQSTVTGTPVDNHPSAAEQSVANHQAVMGHSAFNEIASNQLAYGYPAEGAQGTAEWQQAYAQPAYGLPAANSQPGNRYTAANGQPVYSSHPSPSRQQQQQHPVSNGQPSYAQPASAGQWGQPVAEPQPADAFPSSYPGSCEQPSVPRAPAQRSAFLPMTNACNFTPLSNRAGRLGHGQPQQQQNFQQQQNHWEHQSPQQQQNSHQQEQTFPQQQNHHQQQYPHHQNHQHEQTSQQQHHFAGYQQYAQPPASYQVNGYGPQANGYQPNMSQSNGVQAQGYAPMQYQPMAIGYDLAELTRVSVDGSGVYLDPMWQERYRTSAALLPHHGVLKVAVVGARAGVGKSCLVNHIVGADVAEVCHGGVGSLQEQTLEVVCNGQAWNLRDVPGANGKHFVKGKRTSLKLAQFVKEYQLRESGATDAVIYVTSSAAMANRQTDELKAEEKLLGKLTKAGIPLIIVNTHARKPLDACAKNDCLTKLKLREKSALAICNVHAPWEGPESIEKHRNELDFPKLLQALWPPASRSVSKVEDEGPNLYTHAMATALVKQHVDAALTGIQKPGVVAYTWVFTTHSAMGFVAPIYGAVLETLVRMMLLAVAMYERVGLLKTGSSAAVSDKLNRVQPTEAQMREGEAKTKQEAKKGKAAATSGAVGGAVAETTVVGGIEVGLKEVMVPQLGEEIFNATFEAALATAMKDIVSNSLPLLGALISCATMGHAYKHMAKSVKGIAYERHVQWVKHHKLVG